MHILQEKQYILSEAKKQFKANQHTSDGADLDKQVLASVMSCRCTDIVGHCYN